MTKWYVHLISNTASDLNTSFVLGSPFSEWLLDHRLMTEWYVKVISDTGLNPDTSSYLGSPFIPLESVNDA